MTEWLTDQAKSILNAGYLQDGETPENMFERVANASANRLKKPELASRFKEFMMKGWLCLASPVASNLGTDRALPISCFNSTVGDSMYQIGESIQESMMLTKIGGGLGLGFNNVRTRGSLINGGKNGRTEGIIPFIKMFDSVVVGSSQGGIRKGAFSINLNAKHGCFPDFLKMRRPQGDVNRQCLNIHHAAWFDDEFMNDVHLQKQSVRDIWQETLKTRMETGEPYIAFEDNINNAAPEFYKQHKMKIESTNICTEIVEYSDVNHTFVCCLSSLNLARYDEWKDWPGFIRDCIWFLDGVMQEFIDKSENYPGLEKARRSAIKERSIGLGVLGYHDLLQKRELAFDSSLETMKLNREIFAKIKEEADEGSRELAKVYGEPEWCVGSGFRNLHRIALAPTVTNSRIVGSSPSIEPITANAFVDKTAKGSFIYHNPQLTILLEIKGKNTDQVWKSIVQNEGSVQHLDFLNDHEKEIFLTAREINQFNIIRQAAQRQSFIDQAQSINLFFPADVDPKYFHKIHLEAHLSGIKTLYYCRSSSVLKGDIAARYYSDDCKSCEG